MLSSKLETSEAIVRAVVMSLLSVREELGRLGCERGGARLGEMVRRGRGGWVRVGQYRGTSMAEPRQGPNRQIRGMHRRGC